LNQFYDAKIAPLSHYQEGRQKATAKRKMDLDHRHTTTKAVTGWRIPPPPDGSVSHQKGSSKKMQRIPIPSKEITQVGYQERSETLEIKFEPGGVYQFFNVPADVFDGLMNAASKEGYYQSKIGKRFPCSRVG